MLDGVDRPFVRHAFQGVRAAGGRVHERSGKRVTDGLTDQDLTRRRERGDARPDVDREARVVVALVLDLTKVDPAAHLQADGRRLGSDGTCDGNGNRGTQCDDEEVVPAGVDLPN